MSYLTLDADRLVRDAVDAYLEDRARPDSGGDCVYATRNSQYRVVEGTVHEASDTSLMGAELVGWLVEELGQPLFESRWRPFGRAIFVERKSRHVVVTSRTLSRNAIGGNVSPVPVMRRKPSVIPPSPPIPVLRSTPPPGTSRFPDGSPTPFRVPETVRDSARSIAELPPPPVLRRATPSPASARPEAARSEARSEDSRPTTRPPPDEATIAADRASYENLVEESRTPSSPDGVLDGVVPPGPPNHGAPVSSHAALLQQPPPPPPRPVVLPPVVPPSRKPATTVSVSQEETVEIDMSAEVEELRGGLDGEDVPTRTGR
jgi:hypothetical protein